MSLTTGKQILILEVHIICVQVGSGSNCYYALSQNDKAELVGYQNTFLKIMNGKVFKVIITTFVMSFQKLVQAACVLHPWWRT